MAEEAVVTPGAEEKQNQQGQDTNAKPITLTLDEFDKRLQAETDKRVTEALKTSKAKWQQETAQQIKAEREEAEQLAKLSEEERVKALDKKRDEQLTQRERSLKRKELQIEAVNILDGKKLPVKFASTLLGETAEETLDNINKFEAEWQDAISGAVETRMRGRTPPGAEERDSKKEPTMNEIIRGVARRR